MSITNKIYVNTFFLFVECKPRFQRPHMHCNLKIYFTDLLRKGKYGRIMKEYKNIGGLSDYSHPLSTLGDSNIPAVKLWDI